MSCDGGRRGTAQSTCPSPVDQLLGRCPTAAELAAVRSEISVTIDTTTGPLACTAAAGSADLTGLQERVYQALLVMRALRFSDVSRWADPAQNWNGAVYPLISTLASVLPRGSPSQR